LISQGVHPLWGVKQVQGGENKLFSSTMRQHHSPDGADGCCITSKKSLTCLQLLLQFDVKTSFHVDLQQFSACFRVARVCQRQLGFLISH